MIRISRKIFFLSMLPCIIGLWTISGCGGKDHPGNAGQTGNLIISDSLSWSRRMADSEIYRGTRRSNDKSADQRVQPGFRAVFFAQAILDIWRRYQQEKYLDYTVRVMDALLDGEGNLISYQPSNFNLEYIYSGVILIDLYRITNRDRYRKAARQLRHQLEQQPRSTEGGFWYSQNNPWQIWLEGVYMYVPFLARYAEFYHQPADLVDALHQILFIDGLMRDPKTALRYPRWDESNKMKWADPESGCSTCFWGQGLGFYAMALVDLLESMPENHPKRAQISFVLEDLIKAIVERQDAESGLWYQIIDQGDRVGNYLEASASAMFVYAIAKAVHLNYIDAATWQSARTGYEGITNRLITVDADGLVNLHDISPQGGFDSDSRPKGSFADYISGSRQNNELIGISAFILASLQMETDSTLLVRN